MDHIQSYILIRVLIISCVCNVRAMAVTYTASGENITSFPHDIPNSVTIIKITKTRIGGVDYLEPFPSLAKLFLGFSTMVECPDLRNVSSTIKVFKIYGNSELRYCDICMIYQNCKLCGYMTTHSLPFQISLTLTG